MHIRPILIFDGQDESRYFISCHAEMTGNSTKDPGIDENSRYAGVTFV